MSESLDARSVLEEYDDFIARKRYAEGAEFLELAATAAKQSGDTASLVTLLNELVGHYRKNNERARCYRTIAVLKELLDNGAVSDETEIGTSYLNIGTAYNRFGDPKTAIECYRISEEKYKKTLGTRDYRWGGLYNNAATAYQAEGEFAKAADMFFEAARLMSALDRVEDEATTYINLAHLEDEARGNRGEIKRYLDRAYYLLNTVREPNAYYAWVLEKLAPSFGYFGEEKRATELFDRAKKIYDSLSDKADGRQGRQ